MIGIDAKDQPETDANSLQEVEKKNTKIPW